jgi:hypothetical protein
LPGTERTPRKETKPDDEELSEDAAGSQPFAEMGSLGHTHQMFTRPPEIDNSDLEGEHKGELKMNLVEHLDYELIPEEMWLRLVEWYGGGPAIMRKVICMELTRYHRWSSTRRFSWSL